MQTNDQVQSICYQNVLAEAERHMSDHPEGGMCRDCANCVQRCFDAAPRSIADELTTRYGICSESSPYLVELDEWHDWDECWMEA